MSNGLFITRSFSTPVWLRAIIQLRMRIPVHVYLLMAAGFNTVSSPYTAAAKRLMKVCRQELSEIETCPECYTNAHTKEDWFTEACVSSVKCD